MTATGRPQSRTRRRILFFGEAVSLAHVARPFALAKSLDPASYDIIFACSKRFSTLFGAPPFPVLDLQTIEVARFQTALSRGQPIYDAETLRAYVEEDLRLMRDCAPDVVVGDFRLSLGVSARLQGIPYVTISNAYWSPYARPKYVVPELPFTRILGARAGQRVFDLVRPGAFALHAGPMNQVRKRYGLQSLGPDLRRVYTDADLTLYADLPELVPLHDAPPHHRFIGPIAWSPDVPLPPWWDRVPAGRPNLYVTMGSSGRSELLPTLLKALAGFDVNVLVATADRVVPTDVPANAFVATFLPGEATAARAELVVCNGGSPTSYDGLAAGVPVVGVASNLDQYLNMHYLVQYGAGVLVRAGQATERALRETIAAALGSASLKERAKRLQASIEAFRPEDRFASELRSVLAQSTARQQEGTTSVRH